MARKTNSTPASTPEPQKVCKFAGDKSDEFCSACNGVTMVENGKDISCELCGGYQLNEDGAASAVPDPEPEPAKVLYCAVCGEEQQDTDSGLVCKNGHGGADSIEDPEQAKIIAESYAKQQELSSKRKPTDSKPAQPKQPAATPPKETPKPEAKETPAPADITDDYVSKAFVKEIKAESGISFETKSPDGKSMWYKLTYAESRLLPDDADVEQEKQILWDDVNATLDDQVALTLESLNNE